MLMTSGLGGRFPMGYPVAQITQFSYEEGKAFAEVKARPLAALDRLRYLLLLWPAPISEAAVAPTVAASGAMATGGASAAKPEAKSPVKPVKREHKPASKPARGGTVTR
jgi:rod shape-determining protein MreC